MVFGMSLATFTLIHVLISLAGIASGAVVVAGLLTGKRLEGWTAIFLVTTVLTSATGYLFPFHKLMPSHVVGALSLIVLAIAVVARYRFQMEGRWRATYVVAALISLYFNVFVAIVQAFDKVPALKALAPRQNEPPFVAAQLANLILFIVLGALAIKKFRPAVLVEARSAAAD